MTGPSAHRPFGGEDIFVSAEAYTMVPIYPDKPRTKRRLRRTRGKFGRVDRLKPEAYKTVRGLVVHPLIYQQLRERAKT